MPLWNAWPTHLERLLRSCWDNERVQVRNRCGDYPGSGTSMFVGLAASSPQTFDADIVILETANNDLPEDTPAFREQSLAVNEIFATQLQELPLARQPFLIWLETSWRGACRGQHISGEQTQLQALRAHQLAHASLGPITAALHASHKEASPQGDWLANVYFQDSTHPSRFGQKLVAGVMAQRLTRQLVHRRTAPQMTAADGAAVQRSERWQGQRKFLTRQAADFFSVASRTLIDFTDPVHAARGPRSFVVRKAGFARSEDVPGKPGFIATALGAEVVVRLPPFCAAALVGPLCTYADAGVIEISVITARGASSSLKCPDYMNAVKAGSRVVLATVDTLWHAKTSLHWWLPSGLSAAHAAPCMWLGLRIVAATPPRERNKVKLLALLVSSAGNGSAQ